MKRYLMRQAALQHKIQKAIRTTISELFRSMCFCFGCIKLLYKMIVSIVLIFNKKKPNISYLAPFVFFLVPQT